MVGWILEARGGGARGGEGGEDRVGLAEVVVYTLGGQQKEDCLVEFRGFGWWGERAVIRDSDLL